MSFLTVPGKRLFWHGAVPALQALPPLTALRLAHIASRVASLRPRAPIRHALDLAFPEKSAAEKDAIARSEAAFHLRERLEMAIFPRLDRESAELHVALEDRFHLDSAIREGRGVVLMGAHLGIHGLGPLVLHRMGFPVHVRTFLLPDAELPPEGVYGQKRRRALEASLKVDYMRAGEEGDDPLTPLRRGEILMTTGDGLGPEQCLGESPRILPLLGQPVAWPDQAFRLAETTGAPVLGYFLRSSESGHRLRFTSPLIGPDPLITWVALYEEEVRACPSEWQFWDRFREGALIRRHH